MYDCLCTHFVTNVLVHSKTGQCKMQTADWLLTIVFRVRNSLVLIAWWKQWSAAVCSLYFVLSDSKTTHAPPGAKCQAFDFLKNFSQIFRYVGSLDGQMPHQLALEKASKTPTHQQLFKNFPMCQTICSNVNILRNRTQISDQVRESCLTEVCSFQ